MGTLHDLRRTIRFGDRNGQFRPEGRGLGTVVSGGEVALGPRTRHRGCSGRPPLVLLRDRRACRYSIDPGGQRALDPTAPPARRFHRRKDGLSEPSPAQVHDLPRDLFRWPIHPDELGAGRVAGDLADWFEPHGSKQLLVVEVSIQGVLGRRVEVRAKDQPPAGLDEVR